MAPGVNGPDPEAALASSEALYRATFDQAALGIAHVGLDGRWLRVNDRLCEITGYKREELLGRHFGEITHAEDMPGNLAYVQAIRDGYAPNYLIEKRYRRGDGTLVWVKLTASLLRDASGEPQHFITTVDDISDRKRAEAAVRESEARLRLGFDTARLGMAEWDHARGVFRVDRHVAQMSRGILPADVWLPSDGPERAAWVARLHPDDRPLHEADRAAQREGRIGPAPIEYRISMPDGGWHWIARASAVLERDETGRAARIIDVLQDVTDRKMTDWRVREALDGLPHIAWLIRGDGTAIYYNRRLIEYAGYDVGPDFEARMALVHPEESARVRALSIRGRAGKVVFDVEARLRRHDGAWRWHRLRAVRLESPEPERLAVATAVDIDDIKSIERQLAEANADLEYRVADRTAQLTEAARELALEMNRREAAQAALLQSQKLEALGQLTGGVAHDLNNVLAAVTGSYELIRRRTADPSLLRLVSLGENGAERAAALVRQLLGFARREALKPVLVDPATLLSQLEPLARHAVGLNIAISVDIAPGIWPVVVDAQRLEMALLNLAVNARDAMPDGGTLRISASNVQDGSGEFVAIRVTDDGIGMTDEVLAHAAEPFFTTKPRGKGTGLGLASARGFAEQSGGAMRIESRVGEGTSVTILLPRSLADAASEAGPAASSPSRREAVVLLVDDDDSARPITAALLGDMGFTVIDAATAESALALAREMPRIDALVTDVIMPGADGPTLAAGLRAQRPDLPVLFITGHAGSYILEGEAVLAKPFSANELTGRLLGVMGEG